MFLIELFAVDLLDSSSSSCIDWSVKSLSERPRERRGDWLKFNKRDKQKLRWHTITCNDAASAQFIAVRIEKEEIDYLPVVKSETGCNQEFALSSRKDWIEDINLEREREREGNLEDVQDLLSRWSLEMEESSSPILIILRA